jgi:hypothetical protein
VIQPRGGPCGAAAAGALLRCTCATGTGRSKTAHRPVNDKQSGAPNVHCCNGEEDATAEQMWKEYRAGEVEEAGVDGGRKCSKAMMTVLIDRIGMAYFVPEYR